MFEVISLIGLGLCALMGLGALFSPAWAAGVVRLQADGRPGGYAEFRATYGGLLLLLHLGAMATVIHTGPMISIFVVFPIALGWFGAALGRSASLLFDRDKLNGAGLNPVWILTEIALGTMIGLPILTLFL